jgi:threonine/homoserine/homoserine lactone efflux protein
MVRALGLGLAVGFLIAASPGPIFFLVLRRTLAHCWRNALASGLGVATGDATYAALAAFGVAVITNVLIAQRRWIGLAGGIAIAALGIQALLRQAPTQTLPRNEGGKKLGGAYLSILGLTLANPPTILSFTAVFAGLGLRVGSGWAQAVALVIGVMLGSFVWWIVVTVVASLVRERLTPHIARSIGLFSGAILVALGILIGFQSLN